MVTLGLTADQLISLGDLTLGVLDIGAACQHFAGDGVQGLAGLCAQLLGRNDQIVVDGGQHNHIGQLNIAAVLLYGSLDGGDGQLLTFRGHALGQRRGGHGQRADLAELDGLAAACRDGTLLAELIVHELRHGAVDQIIVVVGLDLVRHGLGGVDGEQLIIKLKGHRCFSFRVEHEFFTA